MIKGFIAFCILVAAITWIALKIAEVTETWK